MQHTQDSMHTHFVLTHSNNKNTISTLAHSQQQQLDEEWLLTAWKRNTNSTKKRKRGVKPYMVILYKSTPIGVLMLASDLLDNIGVHEITEVLHHCTYRG